MEKIEEYIAKQAVQDSICPNCDTNYNDSLCKNTIWVNENLIYCLCSNCNVAFKFKRRIVSDFKSHCRWEYLIRDQNGIYFGVRGYKISLRTYKKNLRQYNFVLNYYLFGIKEIDDLFKEFIGSDGETIERYVDKSFKDPENIIKQGQFSNWHENEDPKFDELLLELEYI